MRDDRRIGRRGLLLGGAAAIGSASVGGYAVERDWLPGRTWAYEHLGLNGEDGAVPDVVPGTVSTSTFTSPNLPGRDVGWACLLPPDLTADGLPVVIALHALGGDHTSVMDLGVDRFLAAAVADGVPPFAVVSVDGGDGYWHPHDGEDAGALVVDELLLAVTGDPTFTGLDTGRIGLLGWSMGGYGALRLGPLLGADRVRAVAAASPAVWSDPDDASPTGFSDADEYEAYAVVGRQEDLDGIAVRIDCGRGDPFFHDVEDYVDGFDGSGVAVTAEIDAGGHDDGYWRRVLPAQLGFLGTALG
ncbi:alpha/beta hydrolase [Nocardioides stalactiti]|uniref:alpha/beta hydrolase n=1 Tax=Nocardioides stalactiti TaxID=2755356 RepID=UPI001602AC88|nr:alpha/beta hydrolase-fold protein [Nocardioides stalactiti]